MPLPGCRSAVCVVCNFLIKIFKISLSQSLSFLLNALTGEAEAFNYFVVAFRNNNITFSK